MTPKAAAAIKEIVGAVRRLYLDSGYSTRDIGEECERVERSPHALFEEAVRAAIEP